MKKYSVVIPVFGNLDWLAALLESLEQNCRRRHAEVVIVNDACDETDTAHLERLHRQRKVDVLVEHGSRRGFAASVNSGVRNSDADEITVLHSDVILGPNTLGRLASRLKPNGPADVVSAISCYAPYSVYMLSSEIHCRFTESFKPGNKPQCTRSEIDASLVGMYGDFNAFCKSARITRPDLVYTEDGYFFAAMFRREMWGSVGEMDESFNDRGLADRLWVDKLLAIGGQMYVDRSTYCHHHGNATSDGPGLCHMPTTADMIAKYEQSRRLVLQETGRLL